MSTKKHDVPEELLSGLLVNYKKPEDLIGENGLLSGNTRNGKSKKNLEGDFGELPIEVPRDRYGSFEPQPIPKHQTR